MEQNIITDATTVAVGIKEIGGAVGVVTALATWAIWKWKKRNVSKE